MESSSSSNQPIKNFSDYVRLALKEGQYLKYIKSYAIECGFKDGNKTGAERINAGISKTLGDICRLGEDIKIQIDNKEYKPQDFAQDSDSSERGRGNLDKVNKAFDALNLPQEFRNQIISEFNQGGRCYGPFAFISFLIIFNSAEGDNIRYLINPFDHPAIGNFSFEKIDNNTVRLNSEFPVNNINSDGPSGSFAIGNTDGNDFVFKLRSSFDFKWDAQNQQIKIENTQAKILPGAELEKYITEQKNSSVAANTKNAADNPDLSDDSGIDSDTEENVERNTSGDFDKDFDSLLGFIDGEFEKKQELQRLQIEESAQEKDLGYYVNLAVQNNDFGAIRNAVEKCRFRQSTGNGRNKLYLTGRKRIDAGILQTANDLQRIGEGSQIQIKDQLYHPSDFFNGMRDKKGDDEKKKYVQNLFKNLSLDDGFRNQIISELNQGGRCDTALSFFQCFMQAKGLASDALIGTDVERQYKFKKLGDNSVSFSANILVNSVNIKSTDPENQFDHTYGSSQEPIMNIENSFDFVWDAAKKEMKVENIKLNITPCKALEEYIKKGNIDCKNAEGNTYDFDKTFAAFLQLTDQRLQELKELGYTSDMPKDKQLANVLEIALDRCDYTKLAAFLDANPTIDITLSQLQKHVNNPMLINKINDMTSGVGQVMKNTAMGTSEIASAFGDDHLVNQYCFASKNWFIAFFDMILVALGFKEPEPETQQDLFGICANNTIYLAKFKK